MLFNSLHGHSCQWSVVLSTKYSPVLGLSLLLSAFCLRVGALVAEVKVRRVTGAPIAMFSE